ncbi:hypothetical protein DL93DRAFT_2073195 [Clavulina sp. PMI_390]|nr:hypothetical protein DL93DRAFT_2073195 [Clavulina sp. PMI_390]
MSSSQSWCTKTNVSTTLASGGERARNSSTRSGLRLSSSRSSFCAPYLFMFRPH